MLAPPATSPVSTDPAEPASTPCAAGDRRGLLAVILGLGAVYAGVHNGYWTPGGDSEVYACIARSLVRGEGLIYNGRAVAIVPPGWPIALAGLMAISASFAFLKATQAVLLVAAFAVFYRILRRYASPRLAALCTLIGGALHPVYPLSFWLHSEPLFLLLGNLAVLGALRVGERRGGTAGRVATVAAVVLLIGASVLVRYGGVFQWLLVAGAFFAGRPRDADVASTRRLARLARLVELRTAGVAVTWLAVGVTFLAAQTSLGLSRERSEPEPTGDILLAQATPPRPSPASTPATAPSDNDPTKQPVEDDPPAKPSVTATDPNAADPNDEAQPAPSTAPATDEPAAAGPVVQESLGHGDPLAAPGGNRELATEYAARAASGGKWIAWLLWYPARFADSTRPLDVVPTLMGWVVLALCGATAWRFARRGHGLWIGAALYLAAIVLLWPNPNARYLVPLGPLAILGTILGVRHIASRRSTRVLVPLFIASVALVNALLYVVDFRIARAGDDYPELWEAGDAASLVAAVAPLREVSIGHKQVAVSERYQNLGRVRFSKSGPRAVQLLLDRDLVPVPNNVSNAPWLPSVADWCAERGVRYYLYQNNIEPWRLWHFRLSPALHERLAGRAPDAEAVGVGGGWELYRLEADANGANILVPVPPATDPAWPRRMPGLD